MKVLLVSDTHGRIDLINELAILENADACIHAGDFGFYAQDSVKRMNQREIHLQLKHSPLPLEQKEELLHAPMAEKYRAIQENRLLGSFTDYLSREKCFAVPVYAVWGNHDDASVVMGLMKNPITNLQLIDELHSVCLDGFQLIGLGGNLTLNNTFTQPYKGLPGTPCRPTSALEQYIRLIGTIYSLPEGAPRILLTHVSPEKEGFLELLAWITKASLTVSGHMGYPGGLLWKSDGQSYSRIRQTYAELIAQYPAWKHELSKFEPQEEDRVIEHINLPDAKDGYAVLELKDSNLRYEMKRNISYG